MMKLITGNIKWIVLLILGIYVMSSKGLEAIKSFFAPTTDVKDEKSESGSTITDEAAEIYAIRLWQAMYAPGTEEDDIFAVFRYLKSRGDFNKVFNAFGERQYSTTFGNVGDPTSPRYNLTQWLTMELDPDEHRTLLNQNPQLNIF